MSGFITIAVAARGEYCAPTPASTCSTSFWSAESSVSCDRLARLHRAHVVDRDRLPDGVVDDPPRTRRARQHRVVLVLQAGAPAPRPSPARGVDAAEHLGRGPVARVHALDVRDGRDAVDRLAGEFQRHDRLRRRGRDVLGHHDAARVGLGDCGEDLQHRHVQQRRHRLRHHRRVAALDQIRVGDDVGRRLGQRQLHPVAIRDRPAGGRDRHVGDLLADRGLLQAVGAHHAEVHRADHRRREQRQERDEDEPDPPVDRHHGPASLAADGRRAHAAAGAGLVGPARRRRRRRGRHRRRPDALPEPESVVGDVPLAPLVGAEVLVPVSVVPAVAAVAAVPDVPLVSVVPAVELEVPLAAVAPAATEVVDAVPVGVRPSPGVDRGALRRRGSAGRGQLGDEIGAVGGMDAAQGSLDAARAGVDELELVGRRA